MDALVICRENTKSGRHDKSGKVLSAKLQKITFVLLNPKLALSRLLLRSSEVTDFKRILGYFRLLMTTCVHSFCKIWLSLRMFLFHPIHFLKFLVKSQPQRSYKKVLILKKSVSEAKMIKTKSLLKNYSFFFL